MDYEADFCRITKVCDDHQGDLVYKGLSGELKFVFGFLEEVFDVVDLQLHHVTDRDILEVFALIQISKYIFHISLLFLLFRRHPVFFIIEFVQIDDQNVFVLRKFLFLLALGYHLLFDHFQNRQQLFG